MAAFFLAFEILQRSDGRGESPILQLRKTHTNQGLQPSRLCSPLGYLQMPRGPVWVAACSAGLDKVCDKMPSTDDSTLVIAFGPDLWRVTPTPILSDSLGPTLCDELKLR